MGKIFGTDDDTCSPPRKNHEISIDKKWQKNMIFQRENEFIIGIENKMAICQVYKRGRGILVAMGKNPNDYGQLRRLIRRGEVIEVEILTWKRAEKGYMVSNLDYLDYKKERNGKSNTKGVQGI